MSAPVVLIVVGAIVTVIGGLAYTGIWRSWAQWSRRAVLLCLFWLGLAILCMGTGAFFLNGPAAGVGLTLLLVTAVSGVTGVVVLLNGTPRWMQPRWYRAVRSR